ncbi:MAG: glycine cleavage system protein GcvH [Planctomycetota bacterium]
MPAPADRSYAESHEWHKVDGDTLELGISQFAVDQLTDVTFVEMQPVGTTFGAGDTVGEVESVKTTSDVYCGVAGEITEVNAAVVDDPSLLNTDPYGQGWLIRVMVTDSAGLDALMSAEDYEAQNA